MASGARLRPPQKLSSRSTTRLFDFIKAPPASDAAIFKRAVSQPLRAGPFVWREHSAVPSKLESAQRLGARMKPTITLNGPIARSAARGTLSNFAHAERRLRRRDQRVGFGSATTEDTAAPSLNTLQCRGRHRH